MKKAEREHLLKIKEMDCCACGRPGPSDAHHITGCGRRISHFHTIPLCKNCHQYGAVSVHRSKKTFELMYGTQMQLLEKIVRENNLQLDINLD